jgi:hypothetical protein
VDPSNPAQSVQVDKKYDPSMQTTYIGILQRALGLSTAQSPEVLSRLHAPLFATKPSSSIELPAGFLPVKNFRHFIIAGEIPEFAFGGSYRLELFLLPTTAAEGEPEAVSTSGGAVGAISVLSRENTVRCAACVGRQKDARPIRGHIALHPELVHKLLDSHGLNDEHTSTQAIEALLLSRVFAARIVTPGGKVLAEAYPPVPNAPAVQGKQMIPERSPRLTLLSKAAAQNGERVVHYYDARSHGSLLDLQWRELRDRYVVIILCRFFAKQLMFLRHTSAPSS